MTKVNDAEVNKSTGLSQRLHRRSLLKAGAVIAPIVVTLHGGVPLAHADSAGLCVMQLVDIANDSSDSRHGYMQIPMKGGQIAQPLIGLTHNQEAKLSDYPDGTELEAFNASPAHWNFIADPTNNRFGFSCVNSIGHYTNAKLS
ncbi:MAG: hypothetical protein JKY84_14305 [Emcibacteraceae bacterium]|nr:hypothetical protein [Emcibacteraceae bacterium]